MISPSCCFPRNGRIRRYGILCQCQTSGNNARNDEEPELKLRDKDTKFNFNENLTSAMVILKQSKTRIEVSIVTPTKKAGKSSNDAEISIP